MLELIVLGKIPGTHFQISFSLWAWIFLLMASICGSAYLYHKYANRVVVELRMARIFFSIAINR